MIGTITAGVSLADVTATTAGGGVTTTTFLGGGGGGGGVYVATTVDDEAIWLHSLLTCATILLLPLMSSMVPAKLPLLSEVRLAARVLLPSRLTVVLGVDVPTTLSSWVAV
jgi:hypothetical protein